MSFRQDAKLLWLDDSLEINFTKALETGADEQEIAEAIEIGKIILKTNGGPVMGGGAVAHPAASSALCVGVPDELAPPLQDVSPYPRDL